MGLIKSIVTNAVNEAIEDAVLGAAAVAMTGIVAAGAVAIDATEKAANCVVAVAKEAGKGVAYVAKGAKNTTQAIGDGLSKVHDYIKDVSSPLAQKRIEKLKNECEELYLFDCDGKNQESDILIYTSELKECFCVTTDKENKEYTLQTFDRSALAFFSKRKKLFKKYISIKTVNKDQHIFEVDTSDDKSKYVMDTSYKIFHNNVLSDYEITYKDVVIAKLIANPVMDVEYALQIFDEDKDFEIFMLIISKIIF